MRRREVKVGMDVKVYREIRHGFWSLVGKKGKVLSTVLFSASFPIKVKLKGIKTPQWLSHKELKEVK